MSSLVREARYSLRSWRRAPGAIVAALAALTLGIGANAAVFSVVSGVLFRTLPYAHPDRLTMLWQDLSPRGGPARDWISPGLFVEWRARAAVFNRLAAVRGWSPNLTGIDEPERLRGAAVSGTYFDALGVPPALGRTLNEADDAPGGPPVVVISDALWTRLFGKDPGLIGQPIVLDGQRVTVVGVMAGDFTPAVIDADVWTPIRIDPAYAPRGVVTLRVLGELKPGVSVAGAQAAMTALAAQLSREDEEWARTTTSVVSLHEDIVGHVRSMLLVLWLAVGVVLAIACANVTSLLVTRTIERSGELSLRAALGATRAQLTTPALIESALLSAIGGATGLLLAWWGVRGLVAVAPASAPRLQAIHVDAGVVAFSIAVMIITALLSGAVPAGLAMNDTAVASQRRHAGRRAGAPLVVGEIALALALVVAAALLVRTFIALQRVDIGFAPEQLLTASVAPPRASYGNPEALRVLYQRLIERCSVIPGVKSAALTNMLPLSGSDFTLSFLIEGRPEPTTAGDAPVAGTRVVSPSYVGTMGMRIVSGRDLSPDDGASAPAVVLVNETMARRYWPDGSALRARLDLDGREVAVVGVVGDVHHKGPGSPPGAEMYIPFSQFNARQMTIVLRTMADPTKVTAALRAAVHEIDPLLPVANVSTMEALLASNVAQPRFVATLLSAFGSVAAVMALVGVYGLLSFSVTRRVRELGVRMALGCGRARVLGLVLRQSAIVVGLGLGVGVALAYGLSRLLQTLLFGISPHDPATISVTAGAIGLAAIVASVPPALRAVRIDPVVALRED